MKWTLQNGLTQRMTQAKAKDLLRQLATHSENQARLKNEPAELLGGDTLSLDSACEIFKQVLCLNKRSTPISERPFDQCHNSEEFHLIMLYSRVVPKETPRSLNPQINVDNEGSKVPERETEPVATLTKCRI